MPVKGELLFLGYSLIRSARARASPSSDFGFFVKAAFMRLRSDIFVSALIKTGSRLNAAAMLRRRGAVEAGAIFVKI